MTSNKHRLASGISLIATAVALGVASPALAQEQTSSLQGRVEGASAGTEVVATDTLTGQRVVGRVDAQGNYAIFGLRPSTYTVAVAGKPALTTTLQVGQTVTLDFVEVPPQEPAADGAIVVTGRRTAQPNQRNFLDFAALSPGVTVTPGTNKQVQAGALSASNVNVLLDGMSFKNPINFGGVFGQNFGLGNPFPQIAVQEYQVQTQNFGAETGQAGSAVISAITKTGGNAFHGSGFIEWQPKSFIGRPEFLSGPKPDYDRKQFGGELGGPIIPGRLSFYVAGEGLAQKLPTSTGNVPPIFPAPLVAEVNTSHAGDFNQGLLFGKLTFYANDADTFHAIGYRRRERNLTDIAGNATESHGRHIITQQDRYQLQWNHRAGDFFNQFNVAYDTGEQATPRVTTGPEFIISNPLASPALCSGLFTGEDLINCQNNAANPDFSEGILTGAHFFEQGDKQRFITFKNDATLRRGQHTLKAGALVNFMRLQRTEANAFEGRYYFFNPGPNGTFDPNVNLPYAARINTVPAPTLKANNTQIGLYVQDEWRPDDHWTVNAGLRWDLETNANNKNYQTPAAVANALRNYPGWAARGIDPEDYISDGNDRKPYWKAFQPRLGVSYDVHGDQDLVFFGGAGRYYDRTLFIASVVEAIKNSSVIRTVFFCPGGGPAQGTGTGVDQANCAQFTPALRDPNNLRSLADSQGGVGGEVWVMPNDIKMPYSDQFDLGVRKRFGDITATVTLSHIRSRNINMYARANFYANGWFTVLPGCTNGGDQWIIDFTPDNPFPGCAATNGQLAGFQGKLNRGLNNGKASYSAIYLQAEKPFTDRSKWGFTTALTLQRAKSNVAQELNSLEFFNGPELDTYGWNRVNGVEKWRWVTSGNFRAPLGFTLSGVLTLSSGPAFGNIVAPWNGLQGPVPAGACCYANMGGVFFPSKDIAYKRLDLRLAKTFTTPWGHELTADFEAFNVFNWLNRTYSSWGAGAGDPAPLTERGQIGNDQRQFQAGLKYKF
jgi:outer membrane receptor protein involved in Fe transport